MYTTNCILFFTYANASPFTTITGSNSVVHGGTKGEDKRQTDSATGRSNAAGRPKVESWMAHAVYLPGQRVWAECSTDGCTAGMWLEHFDAKDNSTPVAFVHLRGRRGVEQRCRAEGGVQGVFRTQGGRRSILSGALVKRVERAKKKMK